MAIHVIIPRDGRSCACRIRRRRRLVVIGSASEMPARGPGAHRETVRFHTASGSDQMCPNSRSRRGPSTNPDPSCLALLPTPSPPAPSPDIGPCRTGGPAEASYGAALRLPWLGSAGGRQAAQDGGHCDRNQRCGPQSSSRAALSYAAALPMLGRGFVLQPKSHASAVTKELITLKQIRFCKMLSQGSRRSNSRGLLLIRNGCIQGARRIHCQIRLLIY